MLRRFYVFSNVLNLIEAVRSIYQNVQYFIRSKKCVLNLATLHILCTSVVKRNYDKKLQFTVYVSPVILAHRSLWKQKKLAVESLSSSDLNLVNFLLWRALQQKLYRQDFRDVDHLKCVCYTAGSDMSNAWKGCQTDCLKERRRCLGYSV